MNIPGASLDSLLADPSTAARVSREDAVLLLTRLASLQLALLQAACAVATPAHRDLDRPTDDRMLEASEAAAMLGVSVRWLYRQAKQLPFTRPIAPKIVRFSRQGIQRWLATRKPLNNPRT